LGEAHEELAQLSPLIRIYWVNFSTGPRTSTVKLTSPKVSSPRRNSLLIMEEGKRREENYGEQGER